MIKFDIGKGNKLKRIICDLSGSRPALTCFVIVFVGKSRISIILAGKKGNGLNGGDCGKFGSTCVITF